jgi:hypothetical protein
LVIASQINNIAKVFWFNEYYSGQKKLIPLYYRERRTETCQHTKDFYRLMDEFCDLCLENNSSEKTLNFFDSIQILYTTLKNTRDLCNAVDDKDLEKVKKLSHEPLFSDVLHEILVRCFISYDMEEVRQLFDIFAKSNTIDMNILDVEGRTLLQTVINRWFDEKNAIEMINLLIQYGVNVDSEVYKTSALELAVNKIVGSTYDRRDVDRARHVIWLLLFNNAKFTQEMYDKVKGGDDVGVKKMFIVVLHMLAKSKNKGFLTNFIKTYVNKNIEGLSFNITSENVIKWAIHRSLKEELEILKKCSSLSNFDLCKFMAVNKGLPLTMFSDFYNNIVKESERKQLVTLAVDMNNTKLLKLIVNTHAHKKKLHAYENGKDCNFKYDYKYV